MTPGEVVKAYMINVVHRNNEGARDELRRLGKSLSLVFDLGYPPADKVDAISGIYFEKTLDRLFEVIDALDAPNSGFTRQATEIHGLTEEQLEKHDKRYERIENRPF